MHVRAATFGTHAAEAVDLDGATASVCGVEVSLAATPADLVCGLGVGGVSEVFSTEDGFRGAVAVLGLPALPPAAAPHFAPKPPAPPVDAPSHAALGF